MTEPIEDDFSLPWAVFRPLALGQGSLTKVARNSTSQSSVRAYLPTGVNSVIVTWSGVAQVEVNIRDQETIYETYTIPAGPRGTTRQLVLDVPTETSNHSVAISGNITSQGDVDRARAGVKIIPFG